MPDFILAIDPGRDKCGIAAVHKIQGVKYKSVVSTEDILFSMEFVRAKYPEIKMIVIGNGTTGKKLIDAIHSYIEDNDLHVETVDERKSTDEARKRYWTENPPTGLMKLIPLGLQSPPRPVDDYVAVILAERFFNRDEE